MRRSRRLRDTLVAAPGLLAHASVTEAIKLSLMGPKLRYTAVQSAVETQRTGASAGDVDTDQSTGGKTRPAG